MKYLTLNEVAEMFSVKPQTIKVWVKNNKIPQPFKIGGAKSHLRWREIDINKYFENLCTQQAGEK